MTTRLRHPRLIKIRRAVLVGAAALSGIFAFGDATVTATCNGSSQTVITGTHGKEQVAASTCDGNLTYAGQIRSLTGLYAYGQATVNGASRWLAGTASTTTWMGDFYSDSDSDARTRLWYSNGAIDTSWRLNVGF